MYLVDTSIVSYSFRLDPLLRLYEDEMQGDAPLVVSAQTVVEILAGVLLRNWGAKRRVRMDESLARFAVLALDHKTAQNCAEIIVEAQRAGRALDLGDAWILATARRYGLTLLSHDRDMLVGKHLGIDVVCRA